MGFTRRIGFMSLFLLIACEGTSTTDLVDGKNVSDGGQQPSAGGNGPSLGGGGGYAGNGGTPLIGGSGGSGGSGLNQPPTADAGQDITVVRGSLATLDGSNSSDPESTELSFLWSLLSTPAGSNAQLVSTTEVRTSFTTDLAGTYRVQLLVSDGPNWSEPDQVLITTKEKEVCTVAASFPAPGAETHGMTFDGSHLWVSGYCTGILYRMDLNGNVVSTLSAPFSCVTGMTFDGTHLWITSDTEPLIAQIDSAGNILQSFAKPSTDSTGLAFDGTYLYNAGFGAPIFKLSTQGDVVDTIPTPGTGPEALTYINGSLWHSDVWTVSLYQLDMLGNVKLQCDSVGGHPLGMAFDGQYLYVSDPGIIYKYAL